MHLVTPPRPRLGGESLGARRVTDRDAGRGMRRRAPQSVVSHGRTCARPLSRAPVAGDAAGLRGSRSRGCCCWPGRRRRQARGRVGSSSLLARSRPAPPGGAGLGASPPRWRGRARGAVQAPRAERRVGQFDATACAAHRQAQAGQAAAAPIRLAGYLVACPSGEPRRSRSSAGVCRAAPRRAEKRRARG